MIPLVGHSQMTGEVRDSLETRLRTIDDNVERVKLLNEIVAFYTSSSNEIAEPYNKQAIALSKKMNYMPGLADAYYGQSLIYFYRGEYEKAKFSSKASITTSRVVGDKAKEANALNRLGYLHKMTGNNEECLNCYLEAMALFESIKEMNGVAASANRIGMFYDDNEDTEKALFYYKKALDFFKEQGTLNQQSAVLNNIGVTYFENEDYEQALSYYEQSLQLLEQENSESRIPARHVNIGKVHMQTGNFELAKSYFQKAQQGALKFNNKRLLSIIFLKRGELGVLEKQYPLGLAYFQKALNIAEEINNENDILTLYENMAGAHFKSGNYQEAYKFKLQQYHLKDSLFGIEKAKQTEELLTKYETERKEKEIALLTKEGEKKDILIYSSVIVVVLLCLLMAVVVNSYKKRVKVNELVQEQKEEINRQNIADLLQEQQLKAIKARLEGQDLERKRVAEDLHDSIGGTLASLKMKLQSIEGRDNDKIKLRSAIDGIDIVYEEIRTVSHNLLPPTFVDSIFTDVIKDFLSEAFESRPEKINFGFHPEKELNELSKNIQVEIYRIVQELINNIIKHAEAKNIDIFVTKHDEYVNIIIEDDGKGFEHINIDKGIGLKNIHSRVKALKGNLDIDSKTGMGTTINVDIKDAKPANFQAIDEKA